MNDYKLTIGIEMHCEVSKTNSKVFSSAKNGYSDTPNINVRPVSLLLKIHKDTRDVLLFWFDLIFHFYKIPPHTP